MLLEDVLRKCEIRVQLAGTIRAAAKLMGVSESHLSLVLHGYRMPGPKILKRLGLRRRRITVFDELPTRTVKAEYSKADTKPESQHVA